MRPKQTRNPMTKPQRYWLVLAFAVAATSAFSREIQFQNTTITLPESIRAETLNDGQGLMLSWAPLSAAVSPLLLMSFPSRTNLQAAVAAQVQSILSMETVGNQALPGVQRVDLSTNAATLGPHNATEIRATIHLKDIGNSTRAYWVFPAAGRVWQLMLPDGGKREIAQARKVIANIKLEANPKTGVPPAPKGRSSEGGPAKRIRAGHGPVVAGRCPDDRKKQPAVWLHPRL
jgi:hypothetical protein